MLLATSVILGTDLCAGELDALKTKYEQTLEAIVLEHGLAVTKIGDEYTKSLFALLARVKGQGDLDRVTAVMDEMARFKRTATVPAELSEPLDIRSLQADYGSSVSEARTRHAGRLVELTRRYDKALERMQRALVAGDRLDDARAVQIERKRAGSSEYYLAAVARLTAIAEAQQQAADATQLRDAPPVERPKGARKFGGHYYMVYREPISWHAAKARCEALGGQLASGEGQAELSFILRFAPKAVLWVGATDENEEGEWHWLNGDRVRAEVLGDGDIFDYAHTTVHRSLLARQADGRTSGRRLAVPRVQGYICEWDR